MRRLIVWLLGMSLLAGCGGAPTSNGPHAEPAPAQFSRRSPDLVQHGERLSQVLGCSGCHTPALTGEKWDDDPGFGTIWSANLTRAAASMSDEDLKRTITSGRRPDGSDLWMMPSHLFTALTSDDLDAVVAFVRSRPVAGDMHPRAVFRDGGRAEIEAGTLKSAAIEVREMGERWPPDAGARHALGRYIVRATCAECHGMTLEGGQPHPGAARRPDLRIIIAAYDRDQFRRLMREGKATGDREVGLMSQVSRGRYRLFDDAELDAIYNYLRALTPAG